MLGEAEQIIAVELFKCEYAGPTSRDPNMTMALAEAAAKRIVNALGVEGYVIRKRAEA